MAVRAFDITQVGTASVSVLERAPQRRRDARRLRQRYTIIGVSAVSVPFLVAIIVIGVVH